MNLPRSVVSALALFVALPLVAPLVGTAEAANIIIGSKTKKEANNKHYRVSATVAEDGPGDIETVTVQVASDSGRETATLTESDAWLHGAAPLAALPAADAELSLTLYDRDSAALITYVGRLGKDGSVTLAEAGAKDAGDCTSRLGCTVAEAPDIELLAAEVFPAARGHEVVVDLAGADAHDVAYATIVVTEWRNGDECLETREGTLCGGTDHFRTVAEVGWDTIGTVWEAELALDHEGPVDVKVKVRADEGPTEVVHASLGLPWHDGGEGVSTLAADEDPLTTLGVMEHDGSTLLAVVSDGWSVAEAPTHAEVELSTGETVTIPANSYQRRGGYFSLASEVAIWEGPARLRIDDSTMTIDGGDLTFADLSSPLCAEGICVTLLSDDTGVGLSVTQYRWDTAFPTDAVRVSLAALDARGGEKVVAEGVVTFGDEVSVVFANEVSFGGDPLRAALAGRVNLLDGGEGATLASGRFFSRVDRQASGGLGLAGVGVDEIAAADTSFALLLQGERSSCGDDDDGFTLPPPLMATFGNGAGTKNASSQASTKPQLL